jgi:7-carboxy-7-deazaguanine synthase
MFSRGSQSRAWQATIMTPSTSLSARLAPLTGKQAGWLLVHEIYRSIQGESTFAGLPCVFIRLAVCDARCTWCDTPHAFNQGSLIRLEEILQRVQEYHCPLVEITGGEPLLQQEAFPLMTRLADLGLTVLLETSGAHDLALVDRRVHIIMDLKCPDSGECAGNRWANLDLLKPTDQIKFVIASRRDFEWAAEAVRANHLDRRFGVLFSPVFSVPPNSSAPHLEPVTLARWLLDSGLHVRLQLQLHKFIWDPQTRGV